MPEAVIRSFSEEYRTVSDRAKDIGKSKLLSAYENDWVVDVLPGNGEYDLGYDYHECGVVKLCNDEGHLELAKYCCRMDYILADIMHMKLVRQGTLAEGADHCDFRYKRI